jgi:hypothetical protein
VSNDIFPTIRGKYITVLKSDESDTIIQSSRARIETRISQMSNPVRHWEFVYDYLWDDPGNLLTGLSATDLQTLRGFINAHTQWDDFLYSDPDDNSVGPGLLPGGTPNVPNAQLQLIQDPTTGTWYSPIQRWLGGNAYEDLADFGPAGVTLFDNGIAKFAPADYTLGGPGLAIPGFASLAVYAQWTGTPTGPITAEFDFLFRVRFEENKQDFEKFLRNLYTIGGSNAQLGSGSLKIVTARTSLV